MSQTRVALGRRDRWRDKARSILIKCAFCAFATILPLAEGCAHAKPYSQKQSVYYASEEHEGEGYAGKKRVSCSLNMHNNVLSFVLSSKTSSKKPTERLQLSMDMPEGVSLSPPLEMKCQPQRTIVVTDQYLARCLGYEDIKDGREMLGILANGALYPQNCVFRDLRSLGKIGRIVVLGNEVELESSKGNCTIDADNPSKPAKCKTNDLKK